MIAVFLPSPHSFPANDGPAWPVPITMQSNTSILNLLNKREAQVRRALHDCDAQRSHHQGTCAGAAALAPHTPLYCKSHPANTGNQAKYYRKRTSNSLEGKLVLPQVARHGWLSPRIQPQVTHG